MSGGSTVPAAEIADRYTIERELGRGATAVVYLARDGSTGRSVALKVLRPELAESLSADRFLREIRVTQQLTHPHIAPVLDSGVAGDLFYCVLDFMDGGTLRDRLERERQLPMAEVAAIARAIGDALAYAHRNRIIHRDVKPENILFGGGHACLADFGIARALETAGGPTTSTGVVRGTPAYMSPEQASGEREYDGRSDVYSFACVLYEAIAGMPAFDGPNTQAVLAQRLIHVPRPLHVYRPTVTAELDAVMARALATAPADRYQSAASFTDALCTAIDDMGSPTAVSATRAAADARARSVRRRRWLWGGVVGAMALIAVVLGPLRRSMPWASSVVVDTTRIAVFPIQGAAVGENLLARGFERWRGITLVDQRAINEQVQRQHGPIGINDGARIAASVGAGRYVLGSIDTASGSKSIDATLYDVRSGALHHARVSMSSDSVALKASAALADSLLLQGQVDDGPDAFAPGSRDLASTQLMIAGQHALQDWDLDAADSLFARAARSDTGSGRPMLWIAQVREWAGQLRQQWVTVAQAAVARRPSLSPAEQIMADGLGALAARQYASACASYQALVRTGQQQFAGYYGLGDCHAKDRIVVADSRSPSGWRYRSSYQQAINGYVTAFKMLPTTYRGFQANAFASLKDLLLLGTNQLVRGSTEGPRHRDFFAVVIRSGDTVALIPGLAGGAFVDQPNVTAAQMAAGVMQLRDVFRTVTSNWASAAPESAEAKQAVSISLEFMGDPAAVDSYARTQGMTTDRLQQLRMAATRAYVQVKVGIPGDSIGLVRTRKIADSLLQAPHGSSPDEIEILAVMAALTGRCHDAAGYLGAVTKPWQAAIQIPRYVVAATDSILAFLAMGCAIPTSSPSLDLLASRLQAPATPDSIVRQAESGLFGRIVRTRFLLDSAWVSRLSSTGDFLLDAENDYLHRRGTEARIRLSRVTRARTGSLAGNLTADAALPEANLWLALGDTAGAGDLLHTSLDFARNYPPMDWSEPAQNVLMVGSMLRAMQLRARLAGTDRLTARRWSSAVAVLWAGADPELQPLVREMRGIASR